MTEATIRALVERFVRAFAHWLENRTVEQHYSAEEGAKLLQVTERTFHNYVDLYETSGGKDGIGPRVVLSHKVVRYSSSSINRFLRARAIAAGQKPFEPVAAVEPEKLEVAI